ncbi:excisionase family DNA-binding protein [Amycolatopsis sp. NPDC050768]|uniref:excisionase family DNA-binding protein n=1 Tax=Amycolatopsis sp. NPDC050768 TaxID=3154839 RepID=UPI003407597B
MLNAEHGYLHMATEASSGQGPSGPRRMLTVEQAADWLAVSRTTMFALIKAEVVPSVLVGRHRRVPANELTAYVERLIAEAGGC